MIKQLWFRRIVIWLGGAVLLWFGFWAALAYGAQRSAHQAVDMMRQQGIAARFASADVTGFPTRVALTLADFSVGDGEAILWSTQTARIEAEVTRPNQFFLDLSRSHRISGLFGSWAVDTENAGMMALFFPNLDIPVADIQFAAQTLRVTGPEMPQLTLGAVAARITDGGAVDGLYDASLELQDLDLASVLTTLPASFQTIPRLAFAGSFVFDRPWDRQLFSQGYPILRGIDVRGLQLSFGPSVLAASGQLTVADNGHLSGMLSITVDQWRPIFELARDLGFVEPGIEDFLIAALDGLAMVDNNPEDITVPLMLRDGLVSFGALSLGMIPAAR
ncbi:DUF2125 domain-containing protein [Roseicyclus sp.]|uniref:DUF2125 domain-containing protein n=1 Tax=Roseicyclus sp. TaxID=1914329 RepID=UPI003F6B31CC